MVCVMGYNTFYTMSDGSPLVTRCSLHHVFPFYYVYLPFISMIARLSARLLHQTIDYRVGSEALEDMLDRARGKISQCPVQSIGQARRPQEQRPLHMTFLCWPSHWPVQSPVKPPPPA